MSEPSRTHISTEELSRRLDEPGLVIADIRGTAAYNGWKLKGKARGGHIQGAVNLPMAWLAGLSESGLGSGQSSCVGRADEIATERSAGSG